MAHSIGSRTHARMAYALRHEGLIPAHHGFVMLGSGAFRNVYLHEETGIAYKVDGGGRQWEYTNKVEYRTAKRLARRVWEHVCIPTVSLYTLKGMARDGSDAYVVAMEFVDGPLGADADDGYSHPGFREYMDAKNVPTDMHGANFVIRRSDNKFVPVDLAS